MTIFLGIAPWVFWLAWFVAWEVNGFRRSHDAWPTLSELVKRWEVKPVSAWPEPHSHWVGISQWTWRRWTVALGIPGLGTVLELHWVFEVF